MSEFQLTKDDVNFMKRASRIEITIEGKIATIAMTEDLHTIKRGVTLSGSEEHSMQARAYLGYPYGGGTQRFIKGRFSFYVTGAWQALALVAREGDALYVEGSDHSSTAVHEAGLAADTLMVSLTRKGKTLIHSLILQSHTYEIGYYRPLTEAAPVVDAESSTAVALTA